MKKTKRIGIIAISTLLAFTLCSCDMLDGLFNTSSSDANSSESSQKSTDTSSKDNSQGGNSQGQGSGSNDTRVPEITFNDGNLTVDAQGNYCLTRTGGQSYTFRCGYNNAPTGFYITYSLSNP